MPLGVALDYFIARLEIGSYSWPEGKTAEEDGRTPMRASIKVCRPQAPDSNNRLAGDLAWSTVAQTLLLASLLRSCLRFAFELSSCCSNYSIR